MIAILKVYYFLYSRKIKGKDFIEGKLEFEGDYLYDKKYNGKGYDNNGNILYELINGNGQVHEYYKYNDSDKIEYIGEYKNGKKNGKGKEYNKNGKLIFEGEYLNEIKWNGKIYDLNSNNIYELKNGTGFVKEFDYDGNLIFEGEYKNEKRNGKGKEYLGNSTLIFEGEYRNGIKNGKGKEYWGGDIVFEGNYIDGKKQLY